MSGQIYNLRKRSILLGQKEASGYADTSQLYQKGLHVKCLAILRKHNVSQKFETHPLKFYFTEWLICKTCWRRGLYKLEIEKLLRVWKQFFRIQRGQSGLLALLPSCVGYYVCLVFLGLPPCFYSPHLTKI